MAVFLFLKQIVDMLYQYKILDYGMVIFAAVLLFYKIYKDKYTFKDINYLDIVVALLALFMTVAFLREPSGYTVYFKILSGFLIYFLGRVYGKEIMGKGRFLAAASYFIVYANFAYRMVRQDFHIFLDASRETELNLGEFYYYKADMGIAMIIAVIFIYAFSQVRWLKLATLLVICPYMVFYSGARMQQVALGVVYFIIIISQLEKKTKKQFRLDWKFFAGIAGIMVLAVGILTLLPKIPAFSQRFGGNFGFDFSQGIFSERLMHSRHEIWGGILQYFHEQSIGTKLFGIDLVSEYMHNSAGQLSHCMYILILYATGYVGLCLFLAITGIAIVLVNRLQDRKLFYLMLGLWAMYLLNGVSLAAIEFTQMSWFPMLFLGMACSEAIGRKAE